MTWYTNVATVSLFWNTKMATIKKAYIVLITSLSAFKNEISFTMQPYPCVFSWQCIKWRLSWATCNLCQTHTIHINLFILWEFEMGQKVIWRPNNNSVVPYVLSVPRKDISTWNVSGWQECQRKILGKIAFNYHETLNIGDKFSNVWLLRQIVNRWFAFVFSPKAVFFLLE